MRSMWFGSLFGRKWWILLILAGALWVRWDGWSRTVNEDEAFFSIETTSEYQNPALQATGASRRAYTTSHLLFNVADWLRATGRIELVRLPFLLIGILACWFGWRLGRSMGDWLSGLLLAVALALWPFKAYSDVEVRYYGLMLSLPVAQFWLLESWRRKPTWGRMAGALILSALAALTQILSVVLMAAPWIYMLWKLPEGLARLARRRRPGPEYNRFALRWVGQLFALVLITLAVLTANRGRHWMKQQLGFGKPVATAAAPADRSKEVKTPGLGEALAWSSAALTDSIKTRNAPRLLGLQDSPNFFWELLAGLGGRSDFKPGDSTNTLLLLALLLGTVALILRSPPLAVSLWAILLANGMSMDLNRGNYSILTTRYYTLAGLMIVMLATLGVGALMRAARWPVWKTGRRLNAYVTLALGLAIGVAAFAAWQRPARARTQYFIQDWKGLYAKATKRFPLGAYFLGMAAPSQQLYNDLAAARFSERRPSDYWLSPLRNRVEEAYLRMGDTDITLIEQLNPFQGLVVFNPAYWEKDYFPLREYKDFLPREPVADLHGVKATFVPLGREAFVMRGRLTLPLMPRFFASGDGGAHYRMDCHYEVPGIYELLIGGAAAARLIEIKVDGEALQFETAERDPAAERAGPGENGKSWGPARALPLDWKVACEAETNPIDLRPAREYRIRFRVPAAFRQAQPIEMTWSDRLTTATPIVSWSYKNRDWIPATKSVTVGDVYTWSDDQFFYFSLPIRIGTPEKQVIDTTLYLDDPTSKSVVARQSNPLIIEQRHLATGDILWCRPLRIPLAEARARMDKNLRLCILASEGDNAPNGWKLKPEEIVTLGRRLGTGSFMVGMVRFVERDGRLGVMFGTKGS